MKRETITIIATMTVTFTVFFSIEMWRRQSSDSAPLPTPGASAPPPASTSMPAASQTAAAPLQRAEPAAPARRPAADGSPEPAIPPSRYDGPEMPVVFSVAARSIDTAEEDADGSERVVRKTIKEAIILNSLDTPLTVTATEVNVATQEASQTQVALGRGMQKRVGTDQGLAMQSGDEITLRNPSYRDITAQVP